MAMKGVRLHYSPTILQNSTVTPPKPNFPLHLRMVAFGRRKPLQSQPLTRLIVAMICLLRSALTAPRRFTRFAFWTV